MMATLAPGDRFFVDKNVNRPSATALWRGAVAIFTYPNDRTLTYVKRVIALPGDHVEIRDTAVFVNGRSLEQEPITDPSGGHESMVLGDHWRSEKPATAQVT
jgi:signal peptidase I